MIFQSGRPCLLLPNGWSEEGAARRIVVGWNGGKEATRAIASALPFLVAADSVRLVVVPDARTERLFGEEAGADMAAHLSRQGARVELRQCPGDDAGQVLLDQCADARADLLVMGAIGRPHLSEMLFGGATRTVMGATKLPVLLSC